MALEIGIGFDRKKDQIYIGVRDTDRDTELQAKKDITSEFLRASELYFEEGTVREIVSSRGTKSNLYINIKNNEKAIRALINDLIERLPTPNF